MRTSTRSEYVYSVKIAGNPYAVRELQSIWKILQSEPYSIGAALDRDHPYFDFRVYESPRMPMRARLRLFYTIDTGQRVVQLEALDLL